jgi:hypothetical protein
MNRSISFLFLFIFCVIVAVGSYQWYQSQKHLHSIKVWLQTPVDIGYSATEKFDIYIEGNKKFPSISDMRTVGVLIIGEPTVSYIVPMPSESKKELGELHVVLPNGGIDKSLVNQKIIFIRSSDDKWLCTMTISQKYRPENCKDDSPPQPVYAG